VILDVGQQIRIADFFVIVTGSNKKQLQTIADEISRSLKEKGYKKKTIEGYEAGSWICIDYDDVIIHLFQEEARRYYDLEFLWSDAPRVEWQRASA